MAKRRTKEDKSTVQQKKRTKAPFKKNGGKKAKPFARNDKRKKKVHNKRLQQKQSVPDGSSGEEKAAGVKRTSQNIDSEGVPKPKKIKVLSKNGGKTAAKGKGVAKKAAVTMRRERETSDEMKETIKRAKSLWERLRRHDLEKDTRALLLADLMELIKDNLFELVKKHDTARIIQCLLKTGAKDMRAAVFDTLKEHVIELSKLKYAKFVVKALFKYCKPPQREVLISMFYNNVVRLVKHTEAAEIVELAYNDYANAPQRALLVQEFYGPQFALFKDQSGRGLGEILADNPDQSSKLIGHMKQVLLPLMNKSVVKHSIIHKVLLEYLLYADERSRSEVIEGVREVAVEMLHTREGAKVALNCFWHGNAKDRKMLVKSFKGFVPKICKEEHGHLVLMGVFDCVDDTVLVTKTILSEMISSLSELCADRYGRRVLLYLLSPRSSQHFSNQFVQSLFKPGDDNFHSKKPQDTRWAELRSAISPPLIKLASEKAVEWACQKPMAPLLIEVSLSASGDVIPIYDSLVKGLEISGDTSLVQDPCGHWVLKRLIASEREGQPLFSAVLLNKLSDESIFSWVESNRGCFVLTSLLKNSVSRTRISNIIRPFVEKLQEKKHQGIEILIKTINENIN